MYAPCSRSSASGRYLPPPPLLESASMPRSLVPPKAPLPPEQPPAPEDSARFRRTLVRVMSMQVVALLALWWLQARYDR